MFRRCHSMQSDLVDLHFNRWLGAQAFDTAADLVADIVWIKPDRVRKDVARAALEVERDG